MEYINKERSNAIN